MGSRSSKHHVTDRGQDQDENCACLTPPFHHADFDSRHLGTDAANGRYAEVSIDTCRRCGRTWLLYLVEYEAVPHSGRWYRGLVTPAVAAGVTPDSAARVLEGLPWRFRGGSFFGATQREAGGPLMLEM